jgi:hypothetical protein
MSGSNATTGVLGLDLGVFSGTFFGDASGAAAELLTDEVRLNGNWHQTFTICKWIDWWYRCNCRHLSVSGCTAGSL